MKSRQLTKEDIDKVRHIEGFPLGTDKDIIELSRAPYYTACPNPFISEFIQENSTPYNEDSDDYHCEPFAADVSEGKNDPIYTAHTYHTKVPHKAIMKYVEHYTRPGDVIFDGFCGSGMTGVAAEKCGYNSEKFAVDDGKARKAIISDLSPAATFIASNYNLPISRTKFLKIATEIVGTLREKCGWMYETYHTKDETIIPGSNVGQIDYTVWSDIFICPNCSEEINYWKAAVDFETHEAKTTFTCPHCGAVVKKRDCQRVQEVFYDTRLGSQVSIAKQVPVRINYYFGGHRYEKEPDQHDFELIDKIDSTEIPYWYPIDELPKGYNTEQPKRSHGVTHVHYFYTKRTQYLLSVLYDEIEKQDVDIRNALLTLITGILNRNAYKCNRFVINKYNPRGRINGPKSGVLYIPSLVVEQNICDLLDYKIPQISNMFSSQLKNTIITTQSATDLQQIPENCIDYIFTDPPFGDNLNYSELSFMWETWLKVKTNNVPEAVINPVQKKAIHEYQGLMTAAFKEFYRILKPNRWMTVEFHNSKNAVWNGIQEAIHSAGFIIADVRTLDKKRASLHQLVASTAVQQDLAITAYKPKESVSRRIFEEAGSEETVWLFIQQHLENLPVVVIKNEQIEVLAERQAYLLFDRMVAYHVMKGIPVPLDATDFYRGLDEKFLKRDGMYFLPDQVNEYDTARIKTDVEDVQFSLFVTNEKTAVAWLYKQLEEPQTYSVLQPKFMQEVKSVDKFEDMPELATLLEENFLQDEDDHWYIPDTTKEGDVAKLREKKLWKEFEGYMNSKGKLKLFRSEAIRVGFSRLWKDKNYDAIVNIAERLPEQTIQEDPNLLMYYDISLSRV